MSKNKTDQPSPILFLFPEQFQTERLTIRAPQWGDGAMVNEAMRESVDELHLYDIVEARMMNWIMKNTDRLVCIQYDISRNISILASANLRGYSTRFQQLGEAFPALGQVI